MDSLTVAMEPTHSKVISLNPNQNNLTVLINHILKSSNNMECRITTIHYNTEDQHLLSSHSYSVKELSLEITVARQQRSPQSSYTHRLGEKVAFNYSEIIYIFMNMLIS